MCDGGNGGQTPVEIVRSLHAYVMPARIIYVLYVHLFKKKSTKCSIQQQLTFSRKENSKRQTEGEEKKREEWSR